jgi:hypothetical protein
MVRLLEIPFGNPPCRRTTTPSSRTKLGIWFPFLLEGYRTKSIEDGQISRYKARLVEESDGREECISSW